MRMIQEAVSSIVFGIDEVFRQNGFITAEFQQQADGVYLAPIVTERIYQKMMNPALFSGVFNALPCDVFRCQLIVHEKHFSIKLAFDLRYSWTLKMFSQEMLLNNVLRLFEPEKRKINFLREIAFGRKPLGFWVPKSDDAVFNHPVTDVNPVRSKSQSPTKEVPSYLRKRDGLMPCHRPRASSLDVEKQTKNVSPVLRALAKPVSSLKRPDIFNIQRQKRLDPIAKDKGVVSPVVLGRR